MDTAFTEHFNNIPRIHFDLWTVLPWGRKRATSSLIDYLLNKIVCFDGSNLLNSIKLIHFTG